MNYADKILPPPEKVFRSAAREQKIRRDAERIKSFARQVFVLDENGRVVSSFRKNKRNCRINAIAVLAPASFNGSRVPETLVLEIGISRTRPYRKVERSSDGRRFDIVTWRHRVRELTRKEAEAVWPVLKEAIISVMLEDRSAWETKEYKIFARGGSEWNFPRMRGISFSVLADDRHIFRLISAESSKRKEPFLLEYAKGLESWLRKYRYVSYPDRDMKLMKNLNSAVGMWRRLKLSLEDGATVLSMMKEGKRTLLRNALYVFGLKDPLDECDGASQFVGKATFRSIIKGNLVHGKSCALYEVAPTREFVRKEARRGNHI